MEYSELTYSDDTFLSSGIKNHGWGLGDTLCVCIPFWEKMRVYMMCVCEREAEGERREGNEIDISG